MVPDLIETFVQRQRARFFARDLETVVLRGIVRGGDHDSGWIPVLADREREGVSRDHADVDHIRAAIPDAFDERRRQDGARDPHVATNDDGIRPERRHQRPADFPCQGGGQLLRHDPAHVIGLEQRGRSLPVVSAQLVL